VIGTLTVPREEIQTHIEPASETVMGFVSKKTSYLVAGEKTGSKIKPA